RSGCGHGMINSARPGVSQGLIKALLPVDKTLTVSIHDTVQIALPERGFLRAAWMLYAMPLLMTVFAAVLADQLWTPSSLSQAALDLRVTLAAIAGLAAGLLLLRTMSRRMSHDAEFQPRVTGVS
ncbi:MAG: sigma-E factor negative regulatory protein RseC, partial [Congregibacter sp.]